MKFSSRIGALALVAALLFSVPGCSASGGASSAGSQPASSAPAESQKNSSSAAKTTVRVAGLKGPTGLSMVKLMSDNDAGSAKENYEFSLVASPDEIIAKLSSGEADIAAAPTNLAATLYNKTSGGVQLAAVTTLGVLYLLTAGDAQIDSVADLKGKTLYATGQAATPEYAIDYILRQNGLTPGKDVTVEYKGEHAELASLMIAGKADIAVLPEPFVTQVLVKNSSAKIALDLTKEWQQAAGDKSVLTMGCLIVRKAFAQQNKAALDTFLDEYQASAEYANSNVEQTAQLSEKYGIMDAAVAQKAIPNCGITYMDGVEMKGKIPDFLNVLFEADPKSVGGKLPADDFYYQK